MTKCKKWLQTILPILFLLLSLLPIKETFAAENDPVYDKIIQKGELVVGLSADYAPYEFHAKVDGEDKIEIDLPDVAKQADMSKIEPAKRPLLNPTLELSGIYFMQELRRPVEKDQHGNLRELEEELIVNLKKSEYLVAMNVDPEDPKKINIPYLKNKKEEILQPVFTDVMELEKFTKGQKLRIAKVPFAKLPELLIDKAMAYAVNPLGFNLVLNREQLNKIIGLK